MEDDTIFERNVASMLALIGEKPAREGLRETPKRVCKAWKFWTQGYQQDVAEVFKSFEDGGESYDEMVWETGIPFYSHCEHHLAPFFGTVLIAYVPNGKVVGLSKLSRLVDIFARRLQVQERLTVNIADAMMEHLQPKGVGVRLMARHMCMESRGINRQGIETGTTAVRGCFRDDAKTRSEFMSLPLK